MRTFGLMIIILSLMFVFKCGDKGTSNSDTGKEIARIFFLDENDIDTEEISFDPDNRITCKKVVTLGPGIRVIVIDQNNRRFQIDFENVSENNGLKIVNGFAEYINGNGIKYETIGPALQNVDIDWRDNLEFCEFTFKAHLNPVELRSQNDIIRIDSLRIETRREDDL